MTLRTQQFTEKIRSRLRELKEKTRSGESSGFKDVTDVLLKLADNYDCAGLFALLAVGDFEFNLVTVVEGFVATALDFRVVYEQVRPTLLGDEAVALFTVEPLDCTLCACHLILS